MKAECKTWNIDPARFIEHMRSIDNIYKSHAATNATTVTADSFEIKLAKPLAPHTSLGYLARIINGKLVRVARVTPYGVDYNFETN